MSQLVDEAVLLAAAGLVRDQGWAAVTLESVAERSGMSRATLYRRGVTREVISAALAERAAAGWKDAIWPALTASGTAAERLELAVRASCRAVEQFAGVLSSGEPNPIVNLDSNHPIASPLGDVFIDPFTRLLSDGAVDGSLAEHPNPAASAAIIFTTLSRGYLAARRVQGVEPPEAADLVVQLILRGVS